MARVEDEDIDIPGDEDENVGGGSPIKKREKRKKSREERIAERRVIFWTLLIIMIITLGFWLMPNIESLMREGFFKRTPEESTEMTPAAEKQKSKNYIEITL